MPLNSVTSERPVADAVERLVAAVQRRGIPVFARIDHAAGARAAGLELADEVVLVFGDPRSGTALMQAEATIGIELPLRLLVWDDGATTRLGYRDPVALAGDYAVGDALEVLERMRGLLAALVAEAV